MCDAAILYYNIQLLKQMHKERDTTGELGAKLQEAAVSIAALEDGFLDQADLKLKACVTFHIFA